MIVYIQNDTQRHTHFSRSSVDSTSQPRAANSPGVGKMVAELSRSHVAVRDRFVSRCFRICFVCADGALTLGAAGARVLGGAALAYAVRSDNCSRKRRALVEAVAHARHPPPLARSADGPRGCCRGRDLFVVAASSRSAPTPQPPTPPSNRTAAARSGRPGFFWAEIVGSTFIFIPCHP